MKHFTFLLFAFALLISCKSENTLRDNNSNTALPPVTNPTAPAAAPATANVAGGAHYVCTLTGCTGPGADAAGSCSVCGNALAHNQAWHNQNNNAAGQTNSSSGLSPLFTNPTPAPGSNPTVTTPATPEPAQNANGVWHYTCSNGCAGGAGSAIACATCGSTLAHNSAYHN